MFLMYSPADPVAFHGQLSVYDVILVEKQVCAPVCWTDESESLIFAVELHSSGQAHQQRSHR